MMSFVGLMAAVAMMILYLQSRSQEMARVARRMVLMAFAVPVVAFAFGSAAWVVLGFMTDTWRPENWVMFSLAGVPAGAYASWSIGRKFRKR